MSRLSRYYSAAKGPAQQVKISYYVQDLVTDEFVGKSEGWIHDLFFVQEHQIGELPATGKPHLIHHAHVLHKSKCPGRGDLMFKILRVGAAVNHTHLAYGWRIVEKIVDLKEV